MSTHSRRVKRIDAGQGQGGGGGQRQPVLDIYARLSYAPTGETVNVDDQVEMGVETLARRGAVVGQVFKDNSLSAWKPGVVRPDFDRLMERLESGASDGVWVYDVTRFSRKVSEGERLVELASRGIALWSQAGEYDLMTADGRRHFREAMVAAAAESDKIAERVARGKLRRARRGKRYSNARSYALPGFLPLPPGWEPGDPREQVSVERLDAERAVIRDCYRRLLAGDSLSQVVYDLNADGVPSPSGKIGLTAWNTTILKDLVSKAALAGLLVHQGVVIGVISGVEPVVSRAEWERMCALIEARRTGRPPGRKHVLSGLLWCSRCDRAVYGTSSSGMKPGPDGEPVRVYICWKGPGRPGCGTNTIRATIAEEAVFTAMRARLNDPRRADAIAAHLAIVTETRSTLQTEIDRLERDADELVTKTMAWGTARVDRAMQPILARIAELRQEQAHLDTPEHASLTASDAVKDFDDAVDRNDLDTLRSLIRITFPALTLLPPRRHNDHTPERIVFDPPRQDASPYGRSGSE